MKMERRSWVRNVLGALGVGFLVTGEFSMVAKGTGGADGEAILAVPEATGIVPDTKEKVLGIGGFFFRAKDPKMLANWYLENLGISLVPKSPTDTVWMQEAGPTAFTPIRESSNFFEDPQKMWKLNFRVKNLDKMVAQLQAAGTTVKVDPETYPIGRFAQLKDPEGNPLELWQQA